MDEKAIEKLFKTHIDYMREDIKGLTDEVKTFNGKIKKTEEKLEKKINEKTKWNKSLSLFGGMGGGFVAMLAKWLWR